MVREIGTKKSKKILKELESKKISEKAISNINDVNT